MTADPEWQAFYIAVLARNAAVNASQPELKYNPRQASDQILQGHPAAIKLAKVPAVPKVEQFLTKPESQVTKQAGMRWLLRLTCFELRAARLRRALWSLISPA